MNRLVVLVVEVLARSPLGRPGRRRGFALGLHLRTIETPTIVPTAGQWHLTQKINNDLDILFMIDDSSSMTAMQQKLLAQLPTFMNVLEGLPVAPNLHVAVVSSDMGAKSDATLDSCTPLGDQGKFFSQPEGTCLATTLTPGDTFISDVDGVSNFTDPIASVFQCIGLLGATGCGFEHQLASIDRALGADGLGPPPSTNAGFLRPDAYLGIVMLTNEDDCSAPDRHHDLLAQRISRRASPTPTGRSPTIAATAAPAAVTSARIPTRPAPAPYATPPDQPARRTRPATRPSSSSPTARTTTAAPAPSSQSASSSATSGRSSPIPTIQSWSAKSSLRRRLTR